MVLTNKNIVEQDVFVKHQCPQPVIFSKNVILIFDLQLGTNKMDFSTRYAHGKYEGPNSYQSKDMANVKVFVNKQTDEGQMDKRTGQKLFAPDLS